MFRHFTLLALTLVPAASTAGAREALRTRPTDFILRRGPASSELVVAHALPGYISVRPIAVAGVAPAWSTQWLGLDPITPTYANQVAVQSADLDRDGDEDIVVARRRAIGGSLPGDTTVIVFWETGRTPDGAPIFEREPLAGPPGPVEVQVSDFDGDDRPDLVFATVAHRVYAMLGTGPRASGHTGFSAPTPLGPEIAFPGGLTLRDLDADGLPELTVVSRHVTTVGVWLMWNESTPGRPEVDVEHVTEDLPLSTALEDIDGDGHPDLTVFLAEGPTSVYRVGPAVGARLLPPVEVPALVGAARLIPVDLDGDGRLDFVYTNVDGSRVQVAYGDGWPALRRGPALSMDRASLLRLADTDGDGIREVWIGADTSQFIQIWRP